MDSRDDLAALLLDQYLAAEIGLYHAVEAVTIADDAPTNPSTLAERITDAVLAAGWMPADQAGVLFERDRAERDALAATVERVRREVESIPEFARGPDVQRSLRAALDDPGEEDG